MSALGALGQATTLFAGSLGKLTTAVNKAEGSILQSAEAMGGSAIVGGMQTLGDAFTLVGAQLASALMPAFVELTATVLDFAPTFAAVGEYFSSTIEIIIDIFQRLGGVVSYAIESLTTLKMAIDDVVNWVLRKVSFGYAGGEAHTPEEYQKREQGARAALGQVFESGGGEAHGKNVATVFQSLQQSLGKQGQVGFGGIAEAQKQIQMRAFQSDLQAQILKTNMEQLDVARRHLAETQKKPGAVVP